MTGRASGGYGARMTVSARIDLILSTLNATEIGTLDSVAEKLRQVLELLREIQQPELAARAEEVLAALGRGDVAEFKRGRAFLQSKLGHLR